MINLTDIYNRVRYLANQLSQQPKRQPRCVCFTCDKMTLPLCISEIQRYIELPTTLCSIIAQYSDTVVLHECFQCQYSYCSEHYYTTGCCNNVVCNNCATSTKHCKRCEIGHCINLHCIRKVHIYECTLLDYCICSICYRNSKLPEQKNKEQKEILRNEWYFYDEDNVKQIIAADYRSTI